MTTIYDDPSIPDRFEVGDQIDLGKSVYDIRSADYRDDHQFRLNCTETKTGEKVVMVGLYGSAGSSVSGITIWDWSE